MDHRQEIKFILFVAAVIFFACLPIQADEQADELRANLPTLKRADVAQFTDQVWSLQDINLIGYMLEKSDRHLRESFRIKFGLEGIKLSESFESRNVFMDKVAILALRASEDLWGETPPYPSSGTVQFGLRSAVFEVLKKGLEGESFVFEDLEDADKRKILADEFEKSLGVKLPRTFSEKRKEAHRKSGIMQGMPEPNPTGPGTSPTPNTDIHIKGVKQPLENDFPWIISGILFLLILVLLCKMWSWIRK